MKINFRMNAEASGSFTAAKIEKDKVRFYGANIWYIILSIIYTRLLFIHMSMAYL